MREVAQVVDALIKSGARKATKYVSPSKTIKASRPAYKDDKKRKRFLAGSRVDIVLTIGAPNFDEREFARRCKRAGKALPKAVQLKFL